MSVSALEAVNEERLREMLAGLEGVTPGLMGAIVSAMGARKRRYSDMGAPEEQASADLTVAVWLADNMPTIRSIATELLALRSSYGMKVKPRLTDAAIRAACKAHFGSDNADGVSVTVNGQDWTFREAFKRMWHGAWSALTPVPESSSPAPVSVKGLDDDQIMEVIRECFPWKDEGKILDLLVYEKSAPMFPQATYDVPNYRAERFVRAIEARIRSSLQQEEPGVSDVALVSASKRLKAIVEEVEGAFKHGGWRDENGMLLKDTPEWVAFYNAISAKGAQVIAAPSPASEQEPVANPERLALHKKIMGMIADKQRYAGVMLDGRDLHVIAEALLDGAIAEEKAHPPASKPAQGEGVTVTDEMVGRGLAHYSEGGCSGLSEQERREVVEAILWAALTPGAAS